MEIMEAAWDTRDRYLAGTLSQAAIIKVAELCYNFGGGATLLGRLLLVKPFELL